MAQLETNTQELREILNAVNELPTAAEGGGSAAPDLEIRLINQDHEQFISTEAEISIISGNVNDVWEKANIGERVIAGMYYDYWYANSHYIGYSLAMSVNATTMQNNAEGLQILASMPGMNTGARNNIIFLRDGSLALYEYLW